MAAQAPHYAKLLPELPALLHSYLRNAQNDAGQRAMEQLVIEQQRTNRLLQGLTYALIGFALGMVVMQFVIRVRLF